jgi:hypothetical protein
MNEPDTPDTLVAAVRLWQQTPAFHPLTCGHNSDHRILEPVRDGDRVVLACPDCDYRQTAIPEIVIRFWKGRR